ncbi:zn-dependent hydrolases of the beta-lactamase [Colletotrichum truncatum]|uniref:Zn-dependent hydrolases of the beta-lactamase n=1 Tax=Colletotrichum truncatum TaxID=5467 RepID=A0ACC3ZFM4_COLTU|nr:zn-dependent hydrolases of the beta-lactamase [Colletotrichum truncatum]KAF6801610.1 zn-dependent hydrolases of the beta-lactamase [Colletotrichum truncatum]
MVPQSFRSTVHITHITTATSVIEIDGVNFLTDPVFCPAPAEYDITDVMPKGTQKTVLKVSEGPALGLDKIPVIDVVLLSHEDHIDNLDEMGRRLLDGRRVITTPDGAKNLSPRPGVLGIKPWETVIMAINGIEWEITGVPCVHLDGEVTGFVLSTKNFGMSPEGLPNAIYFTGDTILLPEHDEIAKRFHIVISLMNLGDARFPVTGRDEPLQITMGGKEGAQLFKKLGADILVPIHYESWAHFTQHGKELKEAFEEAGVEDKVCWLVPGKRKCLVGPSA